MRISIQTNFNKRRWLHRLFPFLKCRHETVSVEENFDSRYGTHSSYIYCLKCGRSSGELQRNCQHELNSFGNCFLCLDRVKDPCESKPHEWVQDSDTNDYFCKNCGRWKDEMVED